MFVRVLVFVEGDLDQRDIQRVFVRIKGCDDVSVLIFLGYMCLHTNVEARPHPVVEAAFNAIRLNTSFRERDHYLASQFWVALVGVLGLVEMIREAIETSLPSVNVSVVLGDLARHTHRSDRSALHC